MTDLDSLGNYLANDTTFIKIGQPVTEISGPKNRRSHPFLPKFENLTLSDPGYFRQLTIRGGALKAPRPKISKTIVSIFTISYMCILPGVLGMFQLEFFKNSRF